MAEIKFEEMIVLPKKVLINGRITNAERSERLISDGTIVNIIEMAYEFEYDGIRYEGKAMDSIGTQCHEIPQVGSSIEIYFYPDIKKWIRKQSKKKSGISITVRSILLTILTAVLVYFILETYNSDSIEMFVAIFCYTLGIVMVLNEFLFFIDKRRGKYKKVPATFNGYVRHHNRKNHSNTYYKTYILGDTGEVYESPKGSSVTGGMEKGSQVYLYRHIDADRIHEEVNFTMPVIWFLICAFMGTMALLTKWN